MSRRRAPVPPLLLYAFESGALKVTLAAACVVAQALGDVLRRRQMRLPTQVSLITFTLFVTASTADAVVSASQGLAVAVRPAAADVT